MPDEWQVCAKSCRSSDLAAAKRNSRGYTAVMSAMELAAHLVIKLIASEFFRSSRREVGMLMTLVRISVDVTSALALLLNTRMEQANVASFRQRLAFGFRQKADYNKGHKEEQA